MSAEEVYNLLDRALKRRGLMARGGLHLDKDADIAARELGYKTVVLAGHAGSSFWLDFERFKASYHGRDPLDAWSKSVAEPIESEFSCKALYPFEKPWWPFQSWISRTEGLRPSPLAILIHPQYGLWHGYRAAFAFREAIALPPAETLTHSCDDCAEKPCLSACPVEAVSQGAFDLKRCRDHLAGEAGRAGCMVAGCLARNACPVGEEYRYCGAQLRFHMEALELPAG